MKNTIKTLTALFFLLSASSCKEPPFDRVEGFCVENKSNKLIYFLVSYNYPDTVIPDTYNEKRRVLPNSKTSYETNKLEDLFAALPSDTLSIFIFNADTISYNDWQEVRSGYKILKRYDISFDDLSNNKWTITYP